jgi:predicted nucleotidyltransferase
MLQPANNPLERFGLPDSVIERINRVFADYPSIERVLIYGSRAKGNFRRGSDIDLSIIGDRLTDRQLLEIEAKLDDLLLPYTIDLCRFGAVRTAALIDHINRVGLQFFP